MSPLKVKGLTVVSSKDLSCKACGLCCTMFEAADLHVSNVVEMSAYLGLAPGAFMERYCDKLADGEAASFALKIEGGCPFCSGGRCTIYPVRTDTCALFPFDYPCLNLSGQVKAAMAEFKTCFVHELPDDLIIVPDVDRIVISRILFLAKEMYLARYGAECDGPGLMAFHRSGQSQARNPRMREMMHRKLLGEMIRNAPVDPATKQPLLTAEEITAIYDHVREKSQ
jgi:uncharacterized protein